MSFSLTISTEAIAPAHKERQLHGMKLPSLGVHVKAPAAPDKKLKYLHRYMRTRLSISQGVMVTHQVVAAGGGDCLQLMIGN